MATALSPTSVSARKDEPTTTKEFAASIAYLQRGVKNIVKMVNIVNKSPKDEPPLDGEGNPVTKGDIQKMVKAYTVQLGELRKMFSSKKKRSPKTKRSKPNLFYVSDQLVDFYKSANLGTVDPEDPDSEDFSDEISLITEHRIATSGILTSLLNQYIRVNELSSTKMRFHADDHMKKCFKTTKFLIDGEDVSKRDTRPDSKENQLTKISEISKLGKKSSFQRVIDKKATSKGDLYYDDESGYLFTSLMIINNLYRIPTCILTDSEKEFLVDSEAEEMAEKLQEKLKSSTTINKENLKNRKTSD